MINNKYYKIKIFYQKDPIYFQNKSNTIKIRAKIEGGQSPKWRGRARTSMDVHGRPPGGGSMAMSTESQRAAYHLIAAPREKIGAAGSAEVSEDFFTGDPDEIMRRNKAKIREVPS